MTPTEKLLAFARANHRLSPQVRAATEHLLGDTLAVGAAGVSFSETTGLASAVRRWGAGGDARAIGTSERLPAPSAAFLNGFRIHCLEWDSVHAEAVVHALSTITAAVGAAIDRRGGCEGLHARVGGDADLSESHRLQRPVSPQLARRVQRPGRPLR